MRSRSAASPPARHPAPLFAASARAPGLDMACAMILSIAGIAAGALAGGASPAAAQAKLYHTREHALALAFATGEELRPVPLELSAALVETISERAKVEAEFKHTECFQALAGGEVKAYACIDNMLGHERYITYLLRIEHPSGQIAFLEIMQHREASGNLTHYPHFLRRFKGKTVADQVWNNRDIPLITAATESCNALTGGARKLLRLYDLYLKRLPPQG